MKDTQSKNRYSAGSLFAGIGGICLGFENAGFEIIWANDNDQNACKTYRANFKHSINEQSIETLDKIIELGMTTRTWGNPPVYKLDLTDFPRFGHAKGEPVKRPKRDRMRGAISRGQRRDINEAIRFDLGLPPEEED